MSDQRSQKSRVRSHRERQRLEEEAKSKDIFAVAQQLGMKIGRNNKAEWQGHTSFWLDRKNNRFQWYGKGLWGDPVTLVSILQFGARGVEDYKKTYSQAIAYLTNTEVPQFDSTKLPQPKPYYYYLQEAPSLRLAKEYLIHDRGLSPETVHFFEAQGGLAESVWKVTLDDETTVTEPVVVFKHFDGNHKMIGGSVQGIEHHPERHTDHKSGHLKRVIKNSGAYSGLALDIGQPKRIVTCEAPMDLLAYYECHKATLQDVKLIASDGYKPQVLSRYVAEMYGKPGLSLSEKENFLDKFDQLVPTMTGVPQNLITFAYDNDKAGRGFIEQFKTQYPHSENYIAVDLPPLEKGKDKADWNSYLMKEKKENFTRQPKEKETAMENDEESTALKLSEKRVEEIVHALYTQGAAYEYEGNLMGETYVEAYARFKARYPERELEVMAQRLSEWTGETVTLEEMKAIRASLAKTKSPQERRTPSTQTQGKQRTEKPESTVEQDGPLNSSAALSPFEVREKVSQKTQNLLEKEAQEVNNDTKLLQKYEHLIQTQEAQLQMLSEKFVALVRQNEEMLEQLHQASVQKEREMPKEVLTSETTKLAFVSIPQLLQDLREKIVEGKAQVKAFIKGQAQKGLRVTLDTFKIFERLDRIKSGLERLSQKVQHLDTQLKVLSGQVVEEQEVLCLPAPVQDAAATLQKKNHEQMASTPRPQNKFEERLAQAQKENKRVAENYAKQKEAHAKGVRHVQR